VKNSGRNHGASPGDARPNGARRGRFFLYLEGPGDQRILRSWARRLSQPLEQTINEASVLMGGRQPARAVDHFRDQRRRQPDARGLCVLDRDDGEQPGAPAEPGLEFFTWPRRHIESYLLVAAAIRRHTRNTSDLEQIEDILAGADQGPADTDAKGLLGRHGALERELGRPISAAGVAQAMRREEIHEDVHALFERICESAAVRAPQTLVVRKPHPAPPPTDAGPND